MQRRHVLILVLAAVLLTAFSIALSRRDSRDWRANRSRRLLPFPWQDTVAIRIGRAGGEELVFSRDGQGQWSMRVDDELTDSLNPAAVEELGALATLTWREPVQGRTPPDMERAITLTAVSQAGQQVLIAFGDVAGNLRATTIDGDSGTVYGVNQDLLGFLDWPRDRFRNLSLLSLGGGRKPDRITVSPDQANPALALTLEKKAGGWRQTSPVEWPADETRLDLLLRWIDRLRADGIAAEMAGDLEWFGLEPSRAFVEVGYDDPQGKAVVRRVEFGKADGDRVYARVTGRSPVFTIPHEALAEISMDVAAQYPDQWRNFYRQRGLNLVGDGSPDRVVIEQLLPEPVTLALTRHIDQTGAKWTGVLTKGEASRTFAVDPPDGNDPMRPLTALFTGLASLRIKAFLADVAPGPDTVKWTAYPSMRITLSAAGAEGPALTVFAANARGELPSGVPYITGKGEPQELVSLEGYPEKVGFAFSLADKTAIMETFGEMSYLLCLPPYRYQSRRLLDVESRAFGRVEVENLGGKEVYFRREGEINEQWWHDPASPEPLMDDNNRFVAMVLEMSQLRADGFVDEANGDIEKFGLDQPEISAIVYSSSPAGDGEKLFKLALGKEADAEGRRYARLNDSGPVFLAPGRLAKALDETYH